MRDDPSWIGRTLSHYRILEKLGSGGMGEVYLAEDRRLHRRVALKVLPPAMAADPERLERFTREAKAVGGLNHPNIVTVHAVEEVEGLHLLVMECVEGRTLGAVIPPGGLPQERFFELAIPLADAVAAAHERGVTHRDLKPSNVMVTADGRVKVVDFGLAKLRQDLAVRETTALLDGPDRDELTEEGRILGTYPYMSPEQVKGRPSDHRSDIFSLGVVLYEMATGERPFAGETSADLISSILRDEPPPAHEVNRELPRHLDRILGHCLAKDPEHRFQNAKDLRNELRSLQQEVESERLLRSASTQRWRTRGRPGAGRLRGALIATAVAAVLGVAGFLALDRFPASAPEPGVGGAPSSAPAQQREARPSVAVLFFQNLSGDPDLAWLRTGITEMLVTDLSQSPGLRVVSTDRLYQILKDLGRLEEPVVGSDLVRTVADQAEASLVLLGSYARAGENLLVNATLQDARSGEILDAQRVQGVGESSVFSIVDRLSGGIRDAFERSGRVEEVRPPDGDRGIEAVTTSSLEAYRLFVEGTRLIHEVKFDEAVPLFERAVELDPGFAMAHTRLARTFEILGREPDVARSLENAYAHADRLPPRERLYVEGVYSARTRSGYGEALDILDEATRLYPDHHAARYQLGLLHSYLDLHPEAERHFEELLDRGHRREGVYNTLAHVYTAQGKAEQARVLLDEWVSEAPDQWSRKLILAWHALSWGEGDSVRSALEQVEASWPGSPFVAYFRWRLSVLESRWDLAATSATELLGHEDPYWRWRGLTGQAYLALFRGRPPEALDRFRSAADAYGPGEALTAAGRNRAAQALVRLGRWQEALEQAERARRAAPDDWPGWEGTFWAAVAQEHLGRPREADRLAGELAETREFLPGSVEERLHERLTGLLAASRGDMQAARAALARAADLLPERGLPWHRHRFPDHVPLWYELASVHRELGEAAQAERWYRRIVESGTEHVEHPVEYVRSHYFLGRLLDERGDTEGAREAYRRFVELWGDGELDRERVAETRERLAALGAEGAP